MGTRTNYFTNANYRAVAYFIRFEMCGPSAADRAERFAKRFREDNPTFDVNQFYDDCGLIRIGGAK